MELELKKERFLITGGYGFIGSCLIRELINDDLIEIFNIDKLSYSSNTKSFDTSSVRNYQLKKLTSQMLNLSIRPLSNSNQIIFYI